MKAPGRRLVVALLPVALFAALAAVLLVGLGRDPREVPSPLIGRPAPAFALPTLEEPARTLRTEDLRGQVWLLNVWASWCTACRQEHPLLVAWARGAGVPVYGLHYKDGADDGRAWLARLGNPYRASLHDRDGRAGIDWGVYGVPETFVVDRAGIVRYKHIGPLDGQVLRERIEPLLARLRDE